MSDSITVKVGVLGEDTRTFTLPEGTTVFELLTENGFDTENSEVHRNGSQVSESENPELNDGDQIAVVEDKGIRGGIA